MRIQAEKKKKEWRSDGLVHCKAFAARHFRRDSTLKILLPGSEVSSYCSAHHQVCFFSSQFKLFVSCANDYKNKSCGSVLASSCGSGDVTDAPESCRKFYDAGEEQRSFHFPKLLMPSPSRPEGRTEVAPSFGKGNRKKERETSPGTKRRHQPAFKDC